MGEHKKLRVALFLSSDPQVGGGVQEHIYYLSRELRRKGMYVEIFGAETPKTRFENYTPIGYTVELPTPNGNWGSVHFLKNNLNLSQYFSSRKFDIIHIHEPYIPFAAWNIIQNVNIPKVATFHNAWDDTSINNAINVIVPMFQPFFSQNVSGAIFVSKIAKKRWGTVCSSKTNISIINNGVDLDVFKPSKRTLGKNIELLFVGRLVKRKGIDYLMKSFALVNKLYSNTHLTILGDGPEYEWCKRFILHNRLTKDVSLMGKIIGKKKIAYFQKADIFCAPYSDEAHPISVLEAMACGCTIVGFENESFKEIFDSYPTPQFFTKKKDVQILKYTLIDAITHKNLRDSSQLWCLKERKKYSWTTISSQIEKMYYKVLAEK